MHRTRRKSNGEPLREARRSNGACVAECCRLACTDNTRNIEKQAAKANTHADDFASDGEDDEDGRKKGKGRKTEVTANDWKRDEEDGSEHRYANDGLQASRHISQSRM